MFANPAELTNDSLSHRNTNSHIFVFMLAPLFRQTISKSQTKKITNENQIVSIALLIFVFENC